MLRCERRKLGVEVTLCSTTVPLSFHATCICATTIMDLESQLLNDDIAHAVDYHVAFSFRLRTFANVVAPTGQISISRGLKIVVLCQNLARSTNLRTLVGCSSYRIPVRRKGSGNTYILSLSVDIRTPQPSSGKQTMEENREDFSDEKDICAVK
jgi:hypothetical protein